MLQDPALKQQQQKKKAQKDFQQKLTARFVPSRPHSYLSANRFLPKIPIYLNDTYVITNSNILVFFMGRSEWRCLMGL